MCGVVCCVLLGAADVSAQAPAIETVAIVRSTRAGVGGAPLLTERAFVLYRDGRVTRALGAAAAEPPAGRPTADRANDWGRWQLVGGALQIRWNDGDQSRYAKWYRGRPGRAGESLSGVYRNLRGGGSAAGTGSVVVAAARLQFSADGTYSADTQVGATAPGIGGAARGGGQGRYRIDGYTITLTGADGRAVRSLFYVFPDGPAMIGIGSRIYRRD